MTQTTFVGTLDSLEPIRDYVTRNAADAGLDRSATYRLCLAVDEIATNIVMHGYEEAGLTGDIEVAAGIVDDSFQIELKDHGRAYDPDTHQQPPSADLGLPLEDRQIGGLGILLAKDSVDDLQYATGPDGNVHRFVMKFRQDSE
jgi:serine/threonine-protein kinase RsbW